HGRLAADGRRLRTVIETINSITGRVAGDQTAVIPPVETSPRATLPGLILQVGCLVELFVVIDAEGEVGGGNRRACSADLRMEEARGHTREHHLCRKTVHIRDAHAAGVSGNL